MKYIYFALHFPTKILWFKNALKFNFNQDYT